MTVDQLATVITAWMWVDHTVTVCGPGLTVAAGLWATGRAAHGIADRIHRRRELRRIEQYANHPAARRLHTTPRKENES
ncbi:hypothetical protein [Streptomyces lancefieldiae]|uniref:Uncharacterized protein n=1 Tax=Streptomyces lancefieldiae TaxID=3075520 RepID=A0ABU3AIR9_9ACTN|nr:hypothetical protein [Streptomyces sp. DSM 40712]MDT0608791.1 hypothetical protein [Streptomyces sp. DSM 40712]